VEISERYRPNIIKEYDYWILVLHEKQLPYVGRCYSWWKDREPGEGEGKPFSWIPDDAVLESKKIYKEVMLACAALAYETIPFGTDFLLNKNYMANEEVHRHHMHEHFIPRSRIEFRVPKVGVLVRDREWGKNYAKPALGEHELPEEHHRTVKAIMAESIVHCR
jgi:diadenosine tetraphosphate (Ap4A) HIT family hydrolase